MMRRGFTDGFRQPKRGLWRMEWVNFRSPLLDAPHFRIPWKWLGIAALFIVLGHLLPFDWAALRFLPMFGMVDLIRVGGFKGDHANADDMYDGGVKLNEFAANTTSLLSRTINAGARRFESGSTAEARIQLAIDQAVSELAAAVFIPAFMLPYDPRLVTFNNAVQMTREGADVSEFDIEAYGATPVLSVADAWSTTGIQAAIDAQHTLARGIVRLPGPFYAISGLRYYTGTHIRGNGNPGTAPTGGTQLYQGSAAAIMLAPNDPTATTKGFSFEGFSLSSFGNTNNLGGVDVTNASRFSVVDVTVAGAAQFGVRALGGVTDGDAGFGHFERVIVNLTQSGSYSWVIGSSATDQPDGLTFTDCFTSTGHGRFIHYTNTGAKTGPGTNSWKGCSFENNSPDTGTQDILYDAAGAGPNTFTDCRFENTGTGGMGVTLNGFTIHPAAIFTNTLFASGSGGLTWVDNGPLLSPRNNCHYTAGYVHNQFLGIAGNVKNTAISYTLTRNDFNVLVTTGSTTMTLPTAVGCAGQWFRIRKTDPARNVVTINSNGGTIDGLTTYVLTNQKPTADLFSDGTNWFSIGQDKTLVSKLVTLTDGAFVDLDLSLGNYFYLSAGGSRTFNSPIKTPASSAWTQPFTVVVKNNTAGAITTTWSVAFGYHLAGAWVDPAPGKVRTITFSVDSAQGVSYELCRSVADIDP